MATIVLRNTVGRALTFQEGDDNFNNLNNDKIENITNESIGDLSDVTITTPSVGELLSYGAAGWENQTLTIPSNLNDLGDIDTSLAATDGQILVFNNTSGFFEAQDPASSGITDVVDDTTPQLGGNLDLNSNDIDGTGNIDITGNVVAQSAINAQTGTTYTTVLADASKLVTLSNASAITLTIPTNASVAYPVGTKIDLAQTGAGQVTVAGAAGVTVNSNPGLKFVAQYSAATCIKTATDTWLLVGNLEA